MAGLSCFLDLKRVALDEFGDQLGKGKAAIVGHFNSRFFYLYRDVKVGLLALTAGCHVRKLCAIFMPSTKKFYFVKIFSGWLVSCVFLAQSLHMKKERTNVYLPSEVKKKAMTLASSAGMSLSVYITQLLIREAARLAGFTKESPALFAAARVRVKTRTKVIEK